MVKEKRMFWAYFEMTTLLLHLLETQGIFSSFHKENLVGLLEAKLMKRWRPS